MNKGLKMNAESAPCHICVKRLLKFGFRKMGYTNKDGNMVIIKLGDFCGYESSSQAKTSKIITSYNYSIPIYSFLFFCRKAL